MLDLPNSNKSAADYGEKSGRPKLSERQKMLHNFWQYYKCREYEKRTTDWYGRAVLDPVQTDQIRHTGFVPPGFESDRTDVPLSHRKPIIQLGIVRIIVSRFTGLLFSAKRHPTLSVPADKDTEEYLGAILEYGNFWSAMQRARAYGGAMGSVAIGFKFLNGDPVFEVFDPRWCTPHFIDHDRKEIGKFEVKYQFPEEVLTNEGKWETRWYWYRRVISRDKDEVWEKVRVRDEEPDWSKYQPKTYFHDFSFVPVEWIQNIPNEEEIDGDPDCQGCYATVEAIDALLSQGHIGVLANCDPTVLLSTDADFAEIKKGSNNAIKLSRGESAQYMEMQGSGPRAAVEYAEKLEERVYRLAQCVPEHVMVNSTGEKTATEVERAYSSMLEKADLLREQYGNGIIRLCHKISKAVRQITSPVTGEDGIEVVGSINLPPRIKVDPSTNMPYEEPRQLGRGTIIQLRWGRYFQPSLNDTEAAVRTATMAKDSMVLDKENTIRFISPFFNDLDPLVVMEALAREEMAQQMADEEAAAAEEEPAEEENLKPDIDILEAGLMTMNEAREKMGLGAMPDGDLTLPQYRNKYPELFAMSNMANGDGLANSFLSQVNEEAGIQQQPPPGKGGFPPGKKGAGEEEEGAEGKDVAKDKPEAAEGQPEAKETKEPPPEESDEGPEVTVEEDESD